MKLTTLFENIKSIDEALKILSIDRGYTIDSLKSAYRRAAMKHHPDRGGSHEAMTDVNLAFELLSKRVGKNESEFIKQVDDEVKESGTYKGGGKYSTTADWEKWMVDSGRGEMLKNIKAKQKAKGGVYETPGERLSRLADDKGLLVEMSLVLFTLGIDKYNIISPFRVEPLNMKNYNMNIDKGSMLVNNKWVPNDIGELGKDLEKSGIMKVVHVGTERERDNEFSWQFMIEIPALSKDEYDRFKFTLVYGPFTHKKVDGKWLLVKPEKPELRTMGAAYEEMQEALKNYLNSLK